MLEIVPNLASNFEHGILFFDGQFDDSRMCVEAIQTACSLEKDFLDFYDYLQNETLDPTDKIKKSNFVIILIYLK